MQGLFLYLGQPARGPQPLARRRSDGTNPGVSHMKCRGLQGLLPFARSLRRRCGARQTRGPIYKVNARECPYTCRPMVTHSLYKQQAHPCPPSIARAKAPASDTSNRLARPVEAHQRGGGGVGRHGLARKVLTPLYLPTMTLARPPNPGPDFVLLTCPFSNSCERGAGASPGASASQSGVNTFSLQKGPF
jgi:hypothetical protein